MSKDYQELQNFHRDSTQGSIAGSNWWKKQGAMMSRGVSQSPYLTCALSLLCAGLLVIIILIVAMTNSAANRTELSFNSRLDNLSVILNSMAEHQSQDGAGMMEKLNDIETTITQISKDSSVMNKLTEIDTSVKRILSEEVTGVLQSDIQRILSSIGRLREEVRKENETQNPLCSQDWRHSAMSCYYLSKRIRTWAGAKKDCEDKKSHLVVITSAEEQEFVSLMTQQMRTWIGLSLQGGSWKWEDGTPFSSSPKFWQKNEPDNWFGQEDCVHLQNDEDGSPWNDDLCSWSFQYICEKKI